MEGYQDPARIQMAAPKAPTSLGGVYPDFSRCLPDQNPEPERRIRPSRDQFTLAGHERYAERMAFAANNFSVEGRAVIAAAIAYHQGASFLLNQKMPAGQVERPVILYHKMDIAIGILALSGAKRRTQTLAIGDEANIQISRHRPGLFKWEGFKSGAVKLVVFNRFGLERGGFRRLQVRRRGGCREETFPA
jgi:hypothetical protein